MVKFTISYQLTVPLNYNAVAAGIYQGRQESIPGYQTFTYLQAIPIPSYLVAFASGNISSYTLPNPKFTFYAEPEILPLAITEFSDIGQLLSAAEEIMTPYFWGKLDLLILPGSFPFGGMENPNLIYVTPSIISGDKSLINVIAHEIAHSWTGNAVTNSTWAHFWLNEGFTVYFERKIIAKVFGKQQADMEQLNGLTVLQKTVNLYGNDHNFTRLNLDIDSIDPDDAFSAIPYEKGCCFLLYLENLVGESHFLEFLREYVSNFQGKNCDSQGFKTFFLEKFTVDIDWNEWLRGTGMPPWLPNIECPLLQQVRDFSENFRSSAKPQGWCTEQFVALLEEFNKKPCEEYVQVAEGLGIHLTKNSEIRVLWLILVAKTRTERYYSDISQFLAEIGRLKFTRPLFRALVESDLKNLALQIFGKNKDFYHSTLVGLLHKEFGFGSLGN
jgi:leukotriene-A4 hydrolase